MVRRRWGGCRARRALTVVLDEIVLAPLLEQLLVRLLVDVVVDVALLTGRWRRAWNWSERFTSPPLSLSARSCASAANLEFTGTLRRLRSIVVRCGARTLAQVAEWRERFTET